MLCFLWRHVFFLFIFVGTQLYKPHYKPSLPDRVETYLHPFSLSKFKLLATRVNYVTASASEYWLILFVSVYNDHDIWWFSETEKILSQALQHFNNLHLNRLRKQYNITAVWTELFNKTQPNLGTMQPLSLTITIIIITSNYLCILLQFQRSVTKPLVPI